MDNVKVTMTTEQITIESDVQIEIVTDDYQEE